MKKRSKSGVEVVATVEEELYTNVRSYIIEGRAKAYVAANTALVETYWKVGKEIVEKQGGAAKSAYGDHLVDGLARRLTIEFGRGYTRVNLFYMRRFYLAFPKVHTLCEQLSWSHYRELITVENEDARRFYAEECVKCRWGVRDLQRQIHTEFYERLLHNKIKPDAVSSLVKKGSEDLKDIIRSPAILEFAGIESDQYLESDLQRNLFAVRYHLHLPTVEELQQEISRERLAIEQAIALQKELPKTKRRIAKRGGK